MDDSSRDKSLKIFLMMGRLSSSNSATSSLLLLLQKTARYTSVRQIKERLVIDKSQSTLAATAEQMRPELEVIYHCVYTGILKPRLSPFWMSW